MKIVDIVWAIAMSYGLITGIEYWGFNIVPDWFHWLYGWGSYSLLLTFFWWKLRK